jgi:hypothetical protein
MENGNQLNAMNLRVQISCLFLLSLMLLSFDLSAQKSKIYEYSPGSGVTIADDQNSLNIRAYIQGASQTNVFNTDSAFYTATRFRMRRLRLRLQGDLLNGRFSYRLNADLSRSTEVADASSGYLLDAFITYNITKRWGLTLGQRTTTTDSRSLRMSSNTLAFTERSRLISAFASIREFGLFLEGNMRLKNGQYIRPSFVLSHGDGLSRMANFGGLKYGGRVDYLPFGLFNTYGQFRQTDLVRELSPKLVIGGYFSFNQGVSSRRGREGGAILYLDENGDYALPDYIKIGVDAMFKFKGLSVYAEWVSTSANVPDEITQRVRNDGTTSGSFLVDGVQDVENYVKGRMMLGSGINIQADYILKSGWSLGGRYTSLNADEHSFLNNTLFYNRPKNYTLGIGKYFDRNYSFRIQADYTWISNDPNSRDIYDNEFIGNQGLASIMATYSF